MRRLFYLFLMSVAVLGAASCAPSRYIATGVVPGVISDMARFETFTDISLIEKGNRAEYSDSLSMVARVALNESLVAFGSALPPAPGEIAFDGPMERLIVEEEVDFIIAEAAAGKTNIRNLGVIPFIDSMLTAYGRRFGLFLVHSGFSRGRGNYGGQVAKSIGIAVLTSVLSAGMVTATMIPYKADSTLHAIVVDGETDRIVFYNRVSTEADPCDPAVLTKQIDRLFRKLFW